MSRLDTKTNQTVTVQAGQSTQLTVSYTQNAAQYQVSVAAAEPNGTVAGGGTFIHNTLVTLTAAANHGYAFSNWTEDGQVVTGAGHLQLLCPPRPSWPISGRSSPCPA